MKPTLSVLFSLLLSLPAAALAADPSSGSSPLRLPTVVRTALAENPGLKSARANWAAVKARVPQAAAWEDLSVSYTGRVGRFVEVSRNAFTDHMLTVEQRVPLNGKNVSRARAASAEAVAAYEELRRRELDLVAKARVGYFRLANVYGQIDLNLRNEALLRDFATISAQRYEVGMQTQADVLAAETERARIVETRSDLERTRSDAESALNVLMNRPARAPLGRPEPLDDAMTHLPPAGELEARALADRPELRIAEKRVEAAQARLQLATREWVPDPAFRVTGQQYNGASQAISEVDVGVTFTVPWLNPGKYRAQTREGRAGVAQAAQELTRLRTETLGLVRDQVQKIETFHHHYEVYRDQILPLARQAVSANQAGYGSGKSGFLELNAAQRTLRDAEAENLTHLAEFQSAVAELEALIGIDFTHSDHDSK